jgi:polyhydroxybutyrate depolymerase
MDVDRRLRLLVWLAVLLACLPTPGCQYARWRAANVTDPDAPSLVHDGLRRTYQLHVPPAYVAIDPVPLVIVLHGGGGTGQGMERLADGLNALADREAFIVVYPNGIDGHWNDGRGSEDGSAAADEVDDVGFLSALISHLAGEFPVDLGRVYVTGISNGGMMSFRMACELPEKIAAVAAAAAAMSEPLSARCSPARPVSVLIMHGTDDPLVPWQGGALTIGPHRGARLLSVADSAAYWAAKDGCAGPSEKLWEPDADSQDGTRVWRQSYGPCAEGTDVVLYGIEGGGHTWPGGWQYLPQVIVGPTSRDINANEVIWRFFQAHTRE